MADLGALFAAQLSRIHPEGHEDGPEPWESYIDDPAEVANVENLRTARHWPPAEE